MMLQRLVEDSDPAIYELKNTTCYWPNLGGCFCCAPAPGSRCSFYRGSLQGVYASDERPATACYWVLGLKMLRLLPCRGYDHLNGSCSVLNCLGHTFCIFECISCAWT
ncbi:uncharacterized protein LOC130797626 isoform X2 [Amaranthus tricolor]|uniref:uncharacterized protein LOC130797626 isoform X2 n=1 Tax=Amaranthus tricolor TaxID=29722 RepID=UPI0025882D78|nr:uncharacterized protein LOC130797626 isoform X2 [Amaranthus tricolor]XP_057516278.1 uncharacterized protein LOC130797626 isoform X2 [Amaranthus tricolor]